MCYLFKQQSEWFWFSTFSEITSLVPNLSSPSHLVVIFALWNRWRNVALCPFSITYKGTWETLLLCKERRGQFACYTQRCWLIPHWFGKHPLSFCCGLSFVLGTTESRVKHAHLVLRQADPWGGRAVKPWASAQTRTRCREFARTHPRASYRVSVPGLAH